MLRQSMEVEINLHPIQAAFRRSEARYRGYVGGIGSGKSWVGAYDLLRRAKPGRLYVTVAPTFPMLRDATWRTLRELAVKLKFFNGENKSYMSMKLGNGAEILGRSTDNPESLRGPNLSGVWMDEGSLMPRETFDIMIGRLREAGEQGWLSATFTPKGKSHWTYKIFGQNSDGCELFKSATHQNPFLPPEFKQNIAAHYSPQLARQELGGEFVAIEGAEFPAEWFSDDLMFDYWPSRWGAKVIALDPSKGKESKAANNKRGIKLGDYSAFIKLMVGLDGHCWVEADLGRHDVKLLADMAVQHQRQFEADVFAVETNQFQELLANEFTRVGRLSGINMPVHHVENTVPKIVRIRRITQFLSRREIHFKANSPGTDLLLSQLMDFPMGDHDDGPDALDMALQAGFGMLSGYEATEEFVY